MTSQRVLDGRYAWGVAVSVFFSTILIGSYAGNGILFVALLEEFDQSSAVLVGIFSFSSVVEGLTGLATGALIQRYGCRVLAVILSCIGTLGFFLCQFTTSVYFLYFTYGVIVGISHGLASNVYEVVIQQSFSKWRTLAASLIKCGSSVSNFMYPPLCQLLIDNYGWRGTYVFWAGAYLQSLPFSVLLVPPGNEIEPEINDNNKEVACKIHSSGDVNVKKNKPRTCSITGEEKEGMEENISWCDIGISEPLKMDDIASIETDNFGEGNFVGKSNESSGCLESRFVEDRHISRMCQHNKDGAVTNNWDHGAFAKAPNTKKHHLESTSNHTSSCKAKAHVFLKTLFDLKLLRDPVYITFVIFKMSTTLARLIPDFFVASFAVSHGIQKPTAALLLSIQAICQLVAGLLTGFVGDVKCVSRLWLCGIWSIIGGVALIGISFATKYIHLLVYSVVFGISKGGFTTVAVPLGVDLMGIQRYPHGLAFITFVEGISYVTVSAICGLIVDATGSFHWPFSIIGALHLASIVLLLGVTKRRICRRLCQH